MKHDSWKPRWDCIAIDTNLLLVLIGYKTLLDLASPKRVQILTDIRMRNDGVLPEAFDSLWLLFKKAKRRIITQHVVAETYNLAKKRLRPLHQYEKRQAWHIAVAFLANRTTVIEELSCTFQDLSGIESAEILDTIGPCDTGLILTAKREGATIVTDDGPLVNWAGIREVPFLTLQGIEGR